MGIEKDAVGRERASFSTVNYDGSLVDVRWERKRIRFDGNDR
jgi:hypothetical protein